MKRKEFGCGPGCPVEVTLDLIDGKWKGVILYHLQEGRLRFGELRKRLPGITQRMLTKQLRALEEDDLITRKVYAEVPPRVDYELSETGLRLRPVIDALKAWGEDHRTRLAATSEGKKARSQPGSVTRQARQPQPA
jgi:DNA-binding HxlR family transcriptional regulator